MKEKEAMGNEERELVAQTEAGLPAEVGDFTGYEGLGTESFIIPRMKVVQPTSKEGEAGTFTVNLTGESFTEVEAVFIKVERGRVMWDPNDSDSNEPLCRSFDFMVPDERIENPPSDRCAEKITQGNKSVLKQVCPKSMWGKDNSRPECDELFNALLCTMDGTPIWVSFAGAQIKPVRRYISAIALRRRRLFEFKTTMTLKTVTEPHKHYVVVFSAPQALEGGEIHAILPVVGMIKGESISRTIEHEESAASDDDAPDNAPTERVPGSDDDYVPPGENDAPPESATQVAEAFDGKVEGRKKGGKKGEQKQEALF